MFSSTSNNHLKTYLYCAIGNTVLILGKPITSPWMKKNVQWPLCWRMWKMLPLVS